MREGFKALSILFILFLSISTVAAQDSENETEESKDVLVELDEATWISDIDWNPENSSDIEVTVESDVPKTVHIQELPDYQGRSGDFSPMESYSLNSGENNVDVPVNGRSTLGVAITSGDNGAYYQKEGENIPDPNSTDAILLSSYGAASTFIFFIVMRGWHKFQLKRGLIKE